MTTPTPRKELRCLVEASAPLSSTMAGGFLAVGFAVGLDAGVTAGTKGDSGNWLLSALFGVFAFFASSLGIFGCCFVCGAGFDCFVMVDSGAWIVNLSRTFLVTASVVAVVGSGIEAVAGTAVGVGTAATDGFAAGFVARVGMDTAAAAAAVFVAGGLAGTGEGNFSFFWVPTATVVARFFVTLVCFLEAGTKVGLGDCGDFGIGTAMGLCALGDETETGLLRTGLLRITGLASVRVGDGDEGGGGGLVSPSKPNNLSVRGASRTRGCDGCCVGGETGVGMVAFSTTGLLTEEGEEMPLAFPFREAGEGGTYPVGGAE